jgi:hypothetical protein
LDTRVQDFETFVNSAGYFAGLQWRNPGFNQGSTDPVIGVNWIDAKAFYKWLTKTEQASGRLANGWVYRLPTDREWGSTIPRHSKGAHLACLLPLHFVRILVFPDSKKDRLSKAVIPRFQYRRESIVPEPMKTIAHLTPNVMPFSVISTPTSP